MIHRKALSLLLGCVVPLTAAATTRAEQPPLPQQAITEQTAGVVYVNARQFTPEALRQSAQSLLDRLPQQFARKKQQIQQQMDKKLQDFSRKRQAFLDAGGRGVVMVVPAAVGEDQPPGSPPRRGQASGDQAEGAQSQPDQSHTPDQSSKQSDPLMMIHVAPGTQAQAFVQALDEVTPGHVQDMDELSKVGQQWLMPTSQKKRLSQQNRGQTAQRLKQLLGQTEDAAFRAAFVANPAMRQRLEQATNQPQRMGPLTPLAQPLKKVSAGYASLQLGQSPSYSQALIFQNEQAARGFKQAWSTMTQMMQGMLSRQLSQGRNGVQPQMIQGLFQTLQPRQQGKKLSLTLGEQFLDRLAEVAPRVVGPFMQHHQRRSMRQQHGQGGMPGRGATQPQQSQPPQPRGVPAPPP